MIKNRAKLKSSKTPEWSCTPFKGLKKILDANTKSPVIQKSIRDKTDEEIFIDAMADVREIKEFRKILPKKPPEFRLPRMRKDDSLDILQGIVSGEIKINLPDTGEYVEWIHPGARKGIAPRLHQGDFSVQDCIDLHGMSLVQAEEAFFSFIKDALRRRLFCVKVIHGRGLRSPEGPVIKKALPGWLQGPFRKWVLAYTTAKDCDGGLGATYIMLKTG
jgi:DNA-nicking Smr family endonuclease